jgi:hypothetical protein
VPSVNSRVLFLQQLIRDGRVTNNHGAEAVYTMDGRFKDYDPKNFKTNLRNMRKSFREGNSTRTSTPTAMNRASAEDKDPVYLKDWHWSKSKQVLRRLIEDGKVTESTPVAEVYTIFDGFKSYKSANFETNLQNLLKSVADDAEATEFDQSALEQDRSNQGPEPENSNLGYPRWYGTDHQNHLQEVVSLGLHEHLDFDEIVEMDPMWAKYPKNVLENHIRQEQN